MNSKYTINMSVPIAEIIDRKLILDLKVSKISTHDERKKVMTKEHVKLIEVLLEAGVNLEDQGSELKALTDTLAYVHKKAWDLIDQLEEYTSSSASDNLIANAFKEAYSLNKQRIELKNKISAYFGGDLCDVKIYS